MPFSNSTNEIIINEEPLKGILFPLFPVASGKMLAGLSPRQWFTSFSGKQEIGTVIMGEGSLSHQLFTEVQLSQAALTDDNAVQLRWDRGRKPLEIGYVNAKGDYAATTGFDSPITETTETLEYFGINQLLLHCLRTCTEKIIGKNHSEVPSIFSVDSIIGAGMQFALQGFSIKVFCEIVSGDPNKLFDYDGKLKISTQQQLHKFPIARALPHMLSARAKLLKT